MSFVLIYSTGDKWRSRRKLITPSFHFRILDEFFKVFVEQTEVLVNTLAKLKDKDYFDIYPYLTRCTLDIICGKKWMNDDHKSENLWMMISF